MVDYTSLENWQAFTGLEGSNPSLSANTQYRDSGIRVNRYTRIQEIKLKAFSKVRR